MSFIGIRLSLAASVVAGGGVSFTPFAYEAETTTLTAAFATPPTTARKRTINRTMKRLKASGILAKATGIWFTGADDDASFKNWKSPGTYDLIKVGTPTRVARGWTATATGQYLNTQLPANVLDPNDLGAYVFGTSGAASNNNEFGVTNASSVGIAVTAMRATTNNMAVRLASAVTTAASDSGDSDGYGLSGASRFDATNLIASHNGVTKNTVALASQALPALPIYLLTNNSNGTASTAFSPRRQLGWYVGKALTPAQERELHAIFGEYEMAVGFGEPIVEEVGIGTQNINAQCVAYGFTVASVFWCLQAARNGKTVALVGGWRDRWNFGGMSTAGLGHIDWNAPTAIGGLPRYITKRIQTLTASGAELFYFEPKILQRIMLELLDPNQNGGYSIPIYQTNGVFSVQKTGTVINNFKTVDGRTFSGLQFHDGTYEGDLLRFAGCSFRMGREAGEASNLESLNGIDGSPVELAGVDPWKTPGVPASGAINLINAVKTSFQPGLNTLPAVGTADPNTVQANNFRPTMTNTVVNRLPFPTTPPPGFNIADYELVLRWLDANSATVTLFSHCFTPYSLVNDKYDVNNRGGVPSSDYIGQNWNYPTGTYAVREANWKAHWNWFLGYVWLLQYGPDARVSAGLRADALNWGLCADHYFSPHENDKIGDNPQLYIRENIRLDGMARLTGNEMNRSDGGVPSISTNTVAVTAYTTDSHAFRWIAYEKTSGNWIVASEGGHGASTGGADGVFPVPLEVLVPKTSECTNLSVSFCVSGTHIAFCATRLEMTAWQAGQSMGQAAVQAINDGTTIQAVNYAAVRSALLANAFALPNEPVPVLPQTT